MNQNLKSYIDFILSLIILIISLPLLILVSFILIVCQRRPIFFTHKRLGLNCKEFTMIKFRTMVNSKSISAKNDETRITRLGSFLRKTSIDELPVLLNVLKGDMSLVGPRPMPVKYLNRFSDFQKKRFSVKPGITGLAQIKGRNQLSWTKRFQYDVQYTIEKSIKLDIIIIIKTIFIVLLRKGVNPKNGEIMSEFFGSEDK